VTYTAADVFTITKQLRYDLTAAQSKLTQLNQALASLNFDDNQEPLRCPHCGPMHGYTQRRLNEHIHNVHPHLEPPNQPQPKAI
jgi:uncharacterized C2H2 Zn-finger protein